MVTGDIHRVYRLPAEKIVEPLPNIGHGFRAPGVLISTEMRESHPVSELLDCVSIVPLNDTNTAGQLRAAGRVLGDEISAEHRLAGFKILFDLLDDRSIIYDDRSWSRWRWRWRWRRCTQARPKFILSAVAGDVGAVARPAHRGCRFLGSIGGLNSILGRWRWRWWWWWWRWRWRWRWWWWRWRR